MILQNLEKKLSLRIEINYNNSNKFNSLIKYNHSVKILCLFKI